MVHSLVYPRPLIKHHYDGHHGIDVYLQDNAFPPVWWRIAWEPVVTKRPESRNSVKIAVLKTTRSVRRSMLMNSIRMTFDFKLLITLFYWTINAMFDVCFTYDLCLGMPSMFYCVVWWCLFQVRNYTVWLLIATRPCLRGWTSTTDPGACQIWGSDRLCQVQ